MITDPEWDAYQRQLRRWIELCLEHRCVLVEANLVLEPQDDVEPFVVTLTMSGEVDASECGIGRTVDAALTEATDAFAKAVEAEVKSRPRSGA